MCSMTIIKAASLFVVLLVFVLLFAVNALLFTTLDRYSFEKQTHTNTNSNKVKPTTEKHKPIRRTKKKKTNKTIVAKQDETTNKFTHDRLEFVVEFDQACVQVVLVARSQQTTLSPSIHSLVCKPIIIVIIVIFVIVD